MSQIEIVDRADGAAGSYCIRKIENGMAWYWNKGKWEAFAQVFKHDKETAQAIATLTQERDALRLALEMALRAIDAFWPDDPPENESEASEDQAIAKVRKVARAALASPEPSKEPK